MTAVNVHETGFEYDDDVVAFLPRAGSADFCRMTRRYDKLSGAPIVEHADPCGCIECLSCGWRGPVDVDGWERTTLGDYVCPSCRQDSEALPF